MSGRGNRRLELAGFALLLAGIASLVVGLLSLGATVEGAYFNRSVGAGPEDGVFATSVDGKGWLIAGTGLVAAGGAASAAALRRQRYLS